MTNLIFGRSKINSFQLARGYMPSIAGLPSKTLTQDRLEAHIQMTASRAIHKAAKSRMPKNFARSMIKEGDKIYVFYKPTNKSLKTEWITATVFNPKEHFVECKRSQKGRPMRVAYEQVRIVPSNEIAKEILESFLEDYIADNQHEDLKTIDQMTEHDNTTDNDTYKEIFGSDSDTDDDEDLQPIGTSCTTIGAMLSTQAIGETRKDVGQTTVKEN